MRLTQVKKLFDDNEIHLEPRRGNQAQVLLNLELPTPTYYYGWGEPLEDEFWARSAGVADDSDSGATMGLGPDDSSSDLSMDSEADLWSYQWRDSTYWR